MHAFLIFKGGKAPKANVLETELHGIDYNYSVIEPSKLYIQLDSVPLMIVVCLTDQIFYITFHVNVHGIQVHMLCEERRNIYDTTYNDKYNL